MPMETQEEKPSDFIRQIIEEDLRTGKNDGRVAVRFPPEPNGFLHIGHAKSICLNFGIAEQYGGPCHLRFDDSNPLTERQEYVDAIKENVRWLEFDWGKHEYYASDYFDQLYEWAVQLIEGGHAFVCDLSPEEISKTRGKLSSRGEESPYRNRSVEENLDLFERMRKGEFEEGSRVLRAKIDMSAGNLLLRDPVMYRIIKASHYRTGDQWCIYPSYDWTHGQSDSIEGITHSICTLEFAEHRPLYDWFLETLGVHHPQQIEFARLNLSHTVVHKRKLLPLVESQVVSGWDDPRMPTLSGLRRRGYSAEAIRDFCSRIGVAKADSEVSVAFLEHCLREDLNKTSPRVMAVLSPLKVVLENYPEDQEEELDAINNPEDESAGIRKVPFSKVLYMEQEDFMEDPPKKFYRLAPGREVRLRYAYFIRCEEVIKDDQGNVVELRCTYDPNTRGGNAPDGRKVKATLHWVSAQHALDGEVRLYDHLFEETEENPVDQTEDEEDMASESDTTRVNPKSLEVLTGCKLEPSLADAQPEDRVQFERLGYFCVDRKDSTPEQLVFCRTVTLRDEWAKIQKSMGKGKKAS